MTKKIAILKFVSHLRTLSLVLLLLISTYSFAITPNNIKDNKTSTERSDSYDFTQHKNRMRKLDWIKYVLNSVNSIIPNPTPEDLDWIRKEQNDISQISDKETKNNRENQLYSSIPYQKNEVKALLRKSLAWVNKIQLSTFPDYHSNIEGKVRVIGLCHCTFQGIYRI